MEIIIRIYDRERLLEAKLHSQLVKDFLCM